MAQRGRGRGGAAGAVHNNHAQYLQAAGQAAGQVPAQNAANVAALIGANALTRRWSLLLYRPTR